MLNGGKSSMAATAETYWLRDENAKTSATSNQSTPSGSTHLLWVRAVAQLRQRRQHDAQRRGVGQRVVHRKGDAAVVQGRLHGPQTSTGLTP